MVVTAAIMDEDRMAMLLVARGASHARVQQTRALDVSFFLILNFGGVFTCTKQEKKFGQSARDLP